MIDWLDYMEAAQAEGWDIFEPSAIEGHDLLEIESLDDFDLLDGDHEAWELIVRKAIEGSELHLVTLAHLREMDCHGELGNMYAHCAEQGIPWPVETPRASWFAMSDDDFDRRVPQAGPFMSYGEAHDAVGHHRIHVLSGDEIARITA